MEYVRSLGATHTLSYQDDQWPVHLQQLTAGHGVDLIWKSNTITGATIYAASMEQKQQWLQELLPGILEGSIRQIVHSFPLSDAAEAQDLLQSRSITGRVVLLPVGKNFSLTVITFYSSFVPEFPARF